MRWLEIRSCCCSTRRSQRSIRYNSSQSLKRSSSSPSTRPPEGRTTVTIARRYFPLSPFDIYEYIYIYFEDFNSSPASWATVSTVWESSHSTHPPASPNFPQAAQQALTYHNHFTHSTLLTLTTGDVSHYHLLRHTQPRLFINQSRCPSTSRPHQSHDCSTRLTVQEPRPPPPHQPACFRPGRARVKPMETIPSSSRKFISPLLLSLSVSFLSLVISLLMFYPLSCSLYWCTYRHSSTLMIKLEAIIDSISCCRVWQWEGEGEGEGEGKERRLRRKGDTQVTFYFSFVLSYTDCMGWSDTPTWYHKASEGRCACGGWYISWEYLFLIYFISLDHSFHFILSPKNAILLSLSNKQHIFNIH